MWEGRWSDEDVAGQGRRGKNMGLELGWANNNIGQGLVFVYGEAGLALDNSRSGVLELTEVAKRSQLAALA
jgi:hypothetical protein